jgi:hypothetical protein
MSLTFAVDLVLNKIRFLDNIGRTKRSTKNEKLENFLTDLQRLTIVHETDHGGSYYRFASGAATPAKGEAEDKPGKAKDAKAIKGAKDAKKGDEGGKGGMQDGDKGLQDHVAGGHAVDKKAGQNESIGASGTATPAGNDQSQSSRDQSPPLPSDNRVPEQNSRGQNSTQTQNYVDNNRYNTQQPQGQAPQYTQNTSSQPPRVDLRHDATGPLDLHLGREIHDQGRNGTSQAPPSTDDESSSTENQRVRF